VEVDADMVEEKLEEAEEEKEEEDNSSIKSNNPHLAGGEIEPEAKERESEGKML